MYHLMSRGNRRQNIYLDDVDRRDFLKTLAEACQKTSWQVHAYCLMSNHYHLVVETPNANLVAGMAWLQSACSLPPAFLAQTDEGPNSRERIFSVRSTFFGFLYQALNPGCACGEVVRQVQALFAPHQFRPGDLVLAGWDLEPGRICC